MILLDSLTSLEFVLDGAVTTNELQFYSAYMDIKADTSSLTPLAPNTGVSNGTTDVEIVAAPDTGYIRQVKLVSVYNADTVNAVVTIKTDDSTNETILTKATITPGGTLSYNGSVWSLDNNVFGDLAYLNTVDTDQIDDNSVTAPKMSASQTDVLFGRETAGAGEGEEIGIGASSGQIPRIDDLGSAALLDYTEADFTPVLADADTGGNASPTTASYARYVRFGNQVTLSVQFTDIDTTGMTGANLLYLRDMPFVADAGGIFIGSVSTDVITPGVVIARLVGGATYLNFYEPDDITAGGMIVSDLTSGQSDIEFTLTYITDAA